MSVQRSTKISSTEVEMVQYKINNSLNSIKEIVIKTQLSCLLVARTYIDVNLILILSKLLSPKLV